MSTTLLSLGIATALALFGCQADASKSDSPNPNAQTMQSQESATAQSTSNKAIAAEAFDALFKSYDAETAERLIHPDYIQHNPHVPTGRAPIMGMLAMLQEAGTAYTNHRMIQDGNLVVMHNSYRNAEAFGAPEVVTFDVLRIENGQLMEHWDAIAPKAEPNPSGRTQVDGETAITDLDQTDANKTLVRNFLDDVLFGKAPEKLAEYVNPTKYLQHNSQIADGLDGLGQALEYLASQNDMFTYKTVHKVIGEGNFVLSVSEGEWHGKPQAFYDLFRIEAGQIVEHWDIIQEIPAEMAHSNGMF